MAHGRFGSCPTPLPQLQVAPILTSLTLVHRSQILCLLPPVLTLYIGLPSTLPPGRGPEWNIVLFFTFISLSRIALWSIDLIQLQILQEALRDHPRRNRLTSLQLALQSAFELSKCESMSVAMVAGEVHSRRADCSLFIRPQSG